MHAMGSSRGKSHSHDSENWQDKLRPDVPFREYCVWTVLQRSPEGRGHSGGSVSASQTRRNTGSSGLTRTRLKPAHRTGADRVKTFGLHDAAAFLRCHPEELRRRTKLGFIPGAKVGRAWVF